GVLNFLFLEPLQRLEVLGQDAHRARLVAFEELGVEIGRGLLHTFPMYHQCYHSRRWTTLRMAKPPTLDTSIVIAAPASRILKAFFDPNALNAWWRVAHAVTTPRAFGPYAIEWAPTDFRDELLGRLGGVFRG